MQWLYEEIKKNNMEWQPIWAMNSTMNWIKAIAFEITEEHGASVELQLQSCNTIFKDIVPCKNKPSLDIIFGPLFHSLTFVESIQTVSCMNGARPWMFSSEIVKWYYSVYNAFKAILAAFNGQETDTHSSMIKALNGGNLRRCLPYPFNMIATWRENEKYDIKFEGNNTFIRQKDVLIKSFQKDRDLAKSMILEYLSGTCKYEADRVKKEILKKLHMKISGLKLQDRSVTKGYQKSLIF